jgi:hypothetical protein
MSDQFHEKAAFFAGERAPDFLCTPRLGGLRAVRTHGKEMSTITENKTAFVKFFVEFIPPWFITSNTDTCLPPNTTARSVSNLVAVVKMTVLPLAQDPCFLKIYI